MENEQNNESDLPGEKNDNGSVSACSCQTGGCDCKEDAKPGKIKIVISLVVLLAAASIITFKVIGLGNNEAKGFSFGQLTQNGTVPAVDVALAEQNYNTFLASLDDLNKVAMDKDAVFIFVPDSKNTSLDTRTIEVTYAVQQTLKSSNKSIGLYTLQYKSPDYYSIANQIQTPAVLVAVKGGGMTAVPCNTITEETLLYAFLACCDKSSGCCPQ